MNTPTDPVADNGQQWWLSNQGKPTGPHSEAFLLAGLKTGTISPQTYVCSVGGQEWKRLSEWPAFASACSVAAAPPPPPPPEDSPATAPAAWNPRTIGWLGLLFSPVWMGIMAAINARRLRTSLPFWRPVAIGVGATALDIVVSACLFDSFIFDLVLYLGTIGLIWFRDLASQVPVFDRGQAERKREASWLVPGLVGSPLALFVLFNFFVYPLLPSSSPKSGTDASSNTFFTPSATSPPTGTSSETVSKKPMVVRFFQSLFDGYDRFRHNHYFVFLILAMLFIAVCRWAALSEQMTYVTRPRS
jgi:hypothetical protein